MLPGSSLTDSRISSFGTRGRTFRKARIAYEFTGAGISGDAMVERTDVFVIGGGPAGLAAAIAARSKGFNVTLADGSHPPIDKACGEGLMPDTLAALRELGVEMGLAEGHVVRGVRFLGQE